MGAAAPAGDGDAARRHRCPPLRLRVRGRPSEGAEELPTEPRRIAPATRLQNVQAGPLATWAVPAPPPRCEDRKGTGGLGGTNCGRAGEERRKRRHSRAAGGGRGHPEEASPRERAAGGLEASLRLV